MVVESEEKQITAIKGYGCRIGKEYAKKEFTNPTRILPTTVKVEGGELPLVPVKTAQPIPKSSLKKAMLEIANIKVKAPIKIGQVILSNLVDTGVELVATRNINKK
jgi:CxxC motif-containing protein